MFAIDQYPVSGIADTTSNETNYNLTVQLSGLTGSTGALVLRDANTGELLNLTADGTYMFSAKLAAGAAYQINVNTQPTLPTKNCTVSGGGTGTIAAADATVTVNCVQPTYNLQVTTTGLSSVGGGLWSRIPRTPTQYTLAPPVRLTLSRSFPKATPTRFGS